MMKRLELRLMMWIIEHSIFIDPCPLPGQKMWEVNVDGETVYIASNNRMFAQLKAKRNYPKAKHIQVVKPLKY